MCSQSAGHWSTLTCRWRTNASDTAPRRRGAVLRSLTSRRLPPANDPKTLKSPKKNWWFTLFGCCNFWHYFCLSLSSVFIIVVSVDCRRRLEAKTERLVWYALLISAISSWPARIGSGKHADLTVSCCYMIGPTRVFKKRRSARWTRAIVGDSFESDAHFYLKQAFISPHSMLRFVVGHTHSRSVVSLSGCIRRRVASSLFFSIVLKP